MDIPDGRSDGQAIIERRSALPDVERLVDARGFVVCDYEGLTRAGRWIWLGHGPECRWIAFIETIYPSFDEAECAAHYRGHATAERIFKHSPARAASARHDVRLRIREIDATGVVGRDYRGAGSAILDPRELRDGRGIEPAWREVKYQHEHEHVDALLLPGPTAAGDLFVFRSAEFVVGDELAHITAPFLTDS